ncbi:helix-turn-helix domain-containing protein [Tardiphaga robiniae]|uniref:Helix-turn-helix transcriptional regulator n=1 Tax=Tardiphaga robiniae TaxID=943830 RepID=A0A7G6U1F3_9BRAD|nr:AraC family transcriptional regulator [Tardiphaga robiniae]QND72835.1 helix-turn-helix transcriptional regulator [Tardiphaga robiniae]
MAQSGEVTAHWTYMCLPVGQLEAAVRRATTILPQAGHFHDKVQIVAVREGWRSFNTVAGEFVAHAGDILVIPAGMFHTPGMCACSTVTNLYVCPTDPIVRGIAAPVILHNTGVIRAAEVLNSIRALSVGRTQPIQTAASAKMRRILIETELAIPKIAKRLGYSTDGFIRNFKRVFGTTPGYYRQVHRLSEARRLLRDGSKPAEAAYAASFADQSHLGRLFVKAYGATPAAYRAGFQSGAVVDSVPDWL